jgi:hypothetical protein
MIELLPFNEYNSYLQEIFQDTAKSYTCDFNYTADTINIHISITNIDDQVSNYEYVLSLQDLYNLSTFTDFCSYVLTLTKENIHLFNYDILTNTYKEEKLWFNLPVNIIPITIRYRHYYETDTFLDGAFTIKLASPKVKFNTNNKLFINDSSARSKHRNRIKWELTGPDTLTANEIGIYNVSHFFNDALSKKPVNLYITHHNGYIPKTFFKLHNGTGTFQVSALGLITGDIIIVKLGSKYFTNEFSKTITIV